MGMFDFLTKQNDAPFNGGEWLTKMRANNPDLATGSSTNIMPSGTFDIDRFNTMNQETGMFGGGYGTKMPSAGSGSMFGGFLSGTDPQTGMKTQGWGNFGLSALQAGAGLYLGNKQLGLAEDQFSEAKRQFGKNFGAQVRSYNTGIRDRQARRYSGAGGSIVTDNPYEQTDEYMAKNRMVV